MTSSDQEDFKLFTTLRYHPLVNKTSFPHQSPFYLVAYHRNRLLQAARFFCWPAAIKAIQGEKGMANFLSRLDGIVKEDASHESTSSNSLRVKVLLSRDGKINIERSSTSPVDDQSLYPMHLNNLMNVKTELAPLEHTKPFIVVILQVSSIKITPCPYTRYKTTYRMHYDSAQREVKIQGLLDKNEVLLLNHLNEVMEGSFNTVYFFRNGHWVTPDLKAGGQDGTTRRWALDQGLCIEGIITLDSLNDGELCCISNGLRGFRCAKLKL